MDAAQAERRTLEEPEEGTVVGGALIGALGRAPLWLFTYGVQFFLAALPAYAVFLWFRDATDGRYEAGSLLHHLDVVFRTDHAGELTALNDAMVAQLLFLVVLYELLSLLFAGGWLQVALERARAHSMRRFFYGGARYFWRFLRLLLVSLLVLGLFRWLLYGWPWQTWVLERWLDVPEHDWEKLETVGSEDTVRLLTWLRDGLFALVFAAVSVWGTYTRTRLALQDTTSVLWAGLLSFFTLLRHPIRTLRPMVGLSLIELALLVGLGYLLSWIEGGLLDASSGWRVAAVFLLAQLAVLPRHVLFGARYLAAVAVSREVVRPLFRPDPWKDSIGGPGGPRYPLEEGDEYGVSL